MRGTKKQKSNQRLMTPAAKLYNADIKIEELEKLVEKFQTVLGSLVTRICVESMIPAGTVRRWQKELDPAHALLKETGWYETEKKR